MSEDSSLDPKSKTPIYIQIAELFISKIENGILSTNMILPSVRDLIKQNNVSKDTVEKAYSELKKRGYIYSAFGKGYFVAPINRSDTLNILFILNNFSLFKQRIYNSFVETIGDKATVSFQVFNYNPHTLNEILENNLWEFNYIVITPFFEINSDPNLCIDVLKKIPENKLVLVDGFMPGVNCKKAVFQDFDSDLIAALTEAKSLISKYKIISIIVPTYKHQLNAVIERSLRQFGDQNKLKVNAFVDVTNIILKKGTLYLILSDEDLVLLLLKAREAKFKIGIDIGIISYNESELKDLLNISVVSTDFKQIGQKAAELILEDKNCLIKNPCTIINRGSI